MVNHEICRKKIAVFENYTKSQLEFVVTLAKLADKPSNAGHLYESRAVDTVLSLVSDRNVTVRTRAVSILAKLAEHSELCAKQMVSSKNVLGDLFGRINKENVRTSLKYFEY